VPKIALIHTTPVTVDSLNKLINDKRSEVELINIVDDSILPELISNQADISLVEERVKYYIQVAVDQGADLVMSACSSIGEIFDQEDENYDIPVMRIDSAMADKAVENAETIGVAATLETTLSPSTELIKKKAAARNKKIEIKTALADSAYQKLMEGNQDEHDRLLAEKLKKLAAEVEIVVLAQASMARAVSTLPAEKQHKFLTSPELGIQKALDKISSDQKGTA
jgi:Asp/Glu/hydantoin racemase